MEQLGIIHHSASPYSSPLHMVPKSSSGWHPCSDYHCLNNSTTPDCYPIPHIHDFSSHLAGTMVFSKVDLVQGYHQIPVATEDMPKTAIIAPFGLFEYLKMPFRLKNAAQVFQCMMDVVCKELLFTFIYLDNILTASATTEQHEKHLHLLFQWLADNGLLNPNKCKFGQSEINFLGYHISATGIQPNQEKVAAIQDFLQLMTRKELQQFARMLNFYHCCILCLAHLMEPIYAALSGVTWHLQWTPKLQISFTDSKLALADAILLHHPQDQAPMALTADALDTAVGVVLEQEFEGLWHPITFFSKKLQSSKWCYSTFDCKLLALYLAVHHFCHFLEAHPFVMFTDHKPLVQAFTKQADLWSPCQQHHLSYISEFSTNIQHVAGQSNIVVDSLSHPSASAVPTDLHCNHHMKVHTQRWALVASISP